MIGYKTMISGLVGLAVGVVATYGVMTMVASSNEPDYDYELRVWQEEGLYWYAQHGTELSAAGITSIGPGNGNLTLRDILGQHPIDTLEESIEGLSGVESDTPVRNLRLAVGFQE